MKNSKILTIVLAIVAVASIIFNIVTLGQKGDLQKKLDEATAQVESLKGEVAKAAEEKKSDVTNDTATLNEIPKE